MGASPPEGSLLKDARALTPMEREAVQDWVAKRYLQLHDKHVGRRRTDLPMPASVRSSSQAERFAQYLRKTGSTGR